MNILNHKKIILIISLMLIAFFAYWFIFVSKKDVNNGINNSSNLKTQVNVSNTVYDKEFVTSLLGLNSINLDVSIFESNVYKSLNYPKIPFTINYSTESGRNNPFLPIGISSNTINVINNNSSTQNNQNNTYLNISTTTIKNINENTSTTTITTIPVTSNPTPTSTSTPKPKPIPKNF